MNKFLLHISGFLFFSLGVMFLVQHFVVNKRLNSGKVYVWQSDWHSFANRNSEVLFVGNSRTWQHIDPKIILKKKGIKSEIIAQDGQDIHLVYLKVREYLNQNPHVKEIYYQHDHNFLNQKNDLFGYSNIAPYFYAKDNLKSLKNRKGYKYLNHIIPLISLPLEHFLKIVLDLELEISKSFENTRGFLPRKGLINNLEPSNDYINTHFKQFKLSTYLDSLVNLCHKSNIKLYPFRPPYTRRMINILDSIELNVQSYAKTELIDANEFFPIDSLNLFSDTIHLNKNGSTLLTEYIIDNDKFFKHLE